MQPRPYVEPQRRRPRAALTLSPLAWLLLAGAIGLLLVLVAFAASGFGRTAGPAAPILRQGSAAVGAPAASPTAAPATTPTPTPTPAPTDTPAPAHHGKHGKDTPKPPSGDGGGG